MTATYSSTRFLLDETQLGAVLALAGIEVRPHSPLASIRPSAQPSLSMLQNTGLLDAAGKKLSPAVSDALVAVANPASKTSFLCIFGENESKEAALCGPDGAEKRFAALARRAPGYELALLPTLDHAAQYAIEFIGSPEPAIQTDVPDVTLSLPAYAALLAGADAARAMALRASLARSRVAKPVLTSVLLGGEWQKSASHPDSHWAAAIARRICPADLIAAGQSADGLGALQSAGFVRPIARGYAFTDAGEETANTFSNLRTAAGVTVAVLHGSEWVPAAHTSVFISAKELWMTVFSHVTAPTGTVRLVRSDGAGLREHLRNLLESDYSTRSRRADVTLDLQPSEKPCPSCAKRNVAGAQFCAWCGSDLSEKKKASCPQCGKTIVEGGAKFCIGCGFRFEARVERHCPGCGKAVTPGKKFCTSCGARVA